MFRLWILLSSMFLSSCASLPSSSLGHIQNYLLTHMKIAENYPPGFRETARASLAFVTNLYGSPYSHITTIDFRTGKTRGRHGETHAIGKPVVEIYLSTPQISSMKHQNRPHPLLVHELVHALYLVELPSDMRKRTEAEGWALYAEILAANPTLTNRQAYTLSLKKFSIEDKEVTAFRPESSEISHRSAQEALFYFRLHALKLLTQTRQHNAIVFRKVIDRQLKKGRQPAA